jgi:hypothetical protein
VLAGAVASTEFFYGWVFVTLVQELYGIRSGEASNRNANKWKTLWRTFFKRQAWLESAENEPLAAAMICKNKFFATK